MTIVLLIVASLLFVTSLVILGRTRTMVDMYKAELSILQKSIDDNLGLSKQLYKFFSALQENQTLQMKAVEIMSKHQKITVSDLNELREQVSNALVAIVEQMASGSGITTLKIKDGKIKLN